MLYIIITIMLYMFCIIGSSVPMQPIDIVHTTLSSELAEVQWLVPVITYTPENYTVIYWTDQALLNYLSDVVTGTSNISDTNRVYSATLKDLQSNTTYYYQVVARNSIGVNVSDIAVLVTPLPSKCIYYSN